MACHAIVFEHCEHHGSPKGSAYVSSVGTGFELLAVRQSLRLHAHIHVIAFGNCRSKPVCMPQREDAEAFLF
jgi:hypothetical protein